MSANPSTVAAKYQAGGLGSIRKWPNSFDQWDYVPLTDAMSIGSRLTRLTSIHDHNCSTKNLRLLMLFVFGFLAVCTVAAWKMPKWIARWGPENGKGSGVEPRFSLFLRKLICTVSFVGFVYRLSTNVSYDTLSHGGYFQV